MSNRPSRQESEGMWYSLPIDAQLASRRTPARRHLRPTRTSKDSMLGEDWVTIAFSSYLIAWLSWGSRVMNLLPPPILSKMCRVCRRLSVLS